MQEVYVSLGTFVLSRDEVQWKQVSYIHDWLSPRQCWAQQKPQLCGIPLLLVRTQKWWHWLHLPPKQSRDERPTAVGWMNSPKQPHRTSTQGGLNGTMVAAAGGGAAEAMFMQRLCPTALALAGRLCTSQFPVFLRCSYHRVYPEMCRNDTPEKKKKLVCEWWLSFERLIVIIFP